jgi:hypothetical protein
LVWVLGHLGNLAPCTTCQDNEAASDRSFIFISSLDSKCKKLFGLIPTSRGNGCIRPDILGAWVRNVCLSIMANRNHTMSYFEAHSL